MIKIGDFVKTTDRGDEVYIVFFIQTTRCHGNDYYIGSTKTGSIRIVSQSDIKQ